MKSVAILALALAAASVSVAAPRARVEPLPQRLSETGLFVPGSTRVSADVMAFSPQYPLWSDGARKRRWIQLPPGRVDRREPSRRVGVSGRHEAVEGVRLRQGDRDAVDRARRRRIVALCGLRLECGRQRRDARARGRRRRRGGATRPAAATRCRARSDCLRVPRGRRRAGAGLQCAAAVAGSRPARAARRRRSVPATWTCAAWSRAACCAACRPHCCARRRASRRRTPTARAALGYLHGNCGHCHNAAGALAGLELVLAQQADGAAHERGAHAGVAARPLEPLPSARQRRRRSASRPGPRQQRADAAHEVATTRSPACRRSACGWWTTEGVALIERWIASDLNPDLSTCQETSR